MIVGAGKIKVNKKGEGVVYASHMIFQNCTTLSLGRIKVVAGDRSVLLMQF